MRALAGLSLAFFAALSSSVVANQQQSRTAHVRAVTVTQPATLVARLTVRCDRCAWDVAGREAVYLSVQLGSRPASVVPVARTGRAEYRVLLGAVVPGAYQLRVDESAENTARGLRNAGAAAIEDIVVDQLTGREGYILSLAPQLHARPNTIGRFTDVPLFMWYEEEPTTAGTRYRFSVIFTNEDGGTPADRLMATWGRTTDIEYVYSVEVDANRRLLNEDIQGPEHKILPFQGARDGTQPQLFVDTDNNMVVDHGPPGGPRYAPAPIAFPLVGVSRERVMDANPWLYEAAAKELVREGKIVADAPPGRGTIPDPRGFVYLEGCGTVGENALTFSVLVNGMWSSSDRGVPDYRIVRDGCFRAAVPLPAAASARDVRAVRVYAHARKDRSSTAPVRFTRFNALFGLDEHHLPGPSLLQWSGLAELQPGGAPLELPVP